MPYIKKLIQVGLGQFKLAQLQLGRGRRRRTERIEMRLEVADGSVVVDQAEDVRLLEAAEQGIRGGRFAEGRAAGDQIAAGAEGESLKEGPPCCVD